MKRRFRARRRAVSAASYPIHLEGRRRVLRQLGLLAAGGAVASVLPACDLFSQNSGEFPSYPAPGDLSLDRVLGDAPDSGPEFPPAEAGHPADGAQAVERGPSADGGDGPVDAPEAGGGAEAGADAAHGQDAGDDAPRP